VVTLLSEADHARVTAAVTAAERASAGEIVTAVAEQSDRYHDAALHWAILAMLAVPALLAWRPDWASATWDAIAGGWSAHPAGAPFVVSLIGGVLAFLLARLLLAYRPLRLALTPGATKTRRVRRQALALFRVGAERRTRGRTGVLIYLSLAERRAEIIADAAIHDHVPEDVWADAMAALLGPVRDGRAADGLVAAVALVGAVLAEHAPRTAGDVNEIPDRLVET
jgi:putative membrane protein